MSDLSALLRHWLRQTELGRGVRLSSDELDLLNSIGVAELLAVKTTEALRNRCQQKTSRSIPVGDTGLNTTVEPMDHFEPRTSRLSGTTETPGETGAAQRARRRSAPQKTH